jgi:hypothetical protein
MDLKEFNRLMAEDAERSQALFNAIMVFNCKTSLDKQQRALLGLYESFSDEIKQDKKVFAESFLRFFKVFPVNQDNIAYHQMFSPMWSTSERQSIETINPQWTWKKASFKNTLEFTKAFEAHAGKLILHPDEIKSFLVKYQDYTDNLSAKEKDKLLTNFLKKDVFKYVINVSYNYFKEFTTQLGFDSNELLKTNYVSENTYYGIGKFFLYDKNNRLSSNELEQLFNDIEEFGLEKFFEHSEFLLPQNQKKKTSQSNMANMIVHFIGEQKYDLASLFFKYFPDSIIKTMGKDYELQDLLDKEAWKTYIEQADYYIDKNHAGIGTNDGKMALRHLDEAFYYINKYILYKNMNENLFENDEGNGSGARPVSKI